MYPGTKAGSSEDHWSPGDTWRVLLELPRTSDTRRQNGARAVSDMGSPSVLGSASVACDPFHSRLTPNCPLRLAQSAQGWRESGHRG